MSNRTYGIIGTGAIGGFYGAKLQKAGHKVSFLLRSDYHHVAENGLIVKSVDGDFTLPEVDAYNDVKKMPNCDVIVVALKANQNHNLPELLPPLINKNTIVLLLQNGINIEPKIANIIGNNTLISGLCVICSNKVGQGQIHHIDYGSILLGQYAGNYQAAGITEQMKEIARDFETAGIPIELNEDLLLARWKKLVWNIPYNSLSVILNARTDEIMANADTRLLAEQIMGEVLAGAKSCGRILGDRFIQKMLDHTENMNPYLTSMKLDYDGKRPLEVETIVGNPLRMASKAGVDLPMISLLYRQLKFLDVRNRLRTAHHR
ncbi:MULTISPECIES: putative 2-dehydropantoate 2-reductase [unclassified Moorena]|uniref:putative 2-dehydropantoate 2-reductase n=1 Tax=unclassified Moorena TaxID=2683338 RepID=UPI0014005889|nr:MULTISPECIES: putative 2-dehydropantoate 2-reductase [unclassified Moorena]NEO17192.1 putative 2-dehydropantoate 2-reductase [Moorena sp. SIO3E8]NEQ03716.1 putative 2-dehydropantoate 2-reductase [Moorena sp. SIO3F7]